ncbi:MULTISPECIES: hypothetical protein [Geobacter]|uniref:hypothetical protein n=1 Tax=Geobacter TaxID=28231 RepID=UPI002572EFD1|nr:hypothetical protein [Geobacter sulfurreducens]BET58110.1 hypothetical protein GEO60473_11500 [Geobacter sp. 60473]
MGEASKRGTFEQRKEQAIQRKQAEQDTIRAKLELRKQQEEQAWKIMVWWQIELSERRYYQIRKRRTDTQMALASLLGMAYGGRWGGIGAIHR